MTAPKLGLAALKAQFEAFRNRNPRLGYHGEWFDVEPEQMAALIEAADERDQLVKYVHIADEHAREIERLKEHAESLARTIKNLSEELARYEAVVEAAREFQRAWREDGLVPSFERVGAALAALEDDANGKSS